MIKSLPNLYSFLRLDKVALEDITANIDSYYEKRKQPKKKFGRAQKQPNGKIRYRYLMAPRYRLKLVQQRINYALQEFPLPENMYGSICGRNNILNAGQHIGHKYFLTIDLENFFSNIDSRQVYKLFRAYDFSHDTANYLTKLTTLKGSLPQGAPTSPVLANLIIADMVKEIGAFVAPFNITFTNYLDDFSFSSDKSFKKLIPDILSIIKRNYFFPAYKKIHYQIDSCEITGLIVSGGQLKMIPEMRMRAYTDPDLKGYLNQIEKFNRQVKNDEKQRGLKYTDYESAITSVAP